MSKRIAKLNVTITYVDGQTAALTLNNGVHHLAENWFWYGPDGMPKELLYRGVDLMNSVRDLIVEHNHVSTD